MRLRDAKNPTDETRTHSFSQIKTATDLSGDELFHHIYEALRSAASLHMGGETPDNTLQATALVHEAYVKLTSQGRTRWESVGQFMVAAAESMRVILIDRARARKAQKRGGGRARKPLDENVLRAEKAIDDLIALDAALTKLQAENADLALVVSLRFFGGLTIHQTAEALNLSAATVKRQWRLAKAWLYAEIEGLPAPDRSSAAQAPHHSPDPPASGDAA